jgi:hypothetical protein
MSAPNHAITVEEEARTEWSGGLSKKNRRILSKRVSCVCGFEGTLGELLCDNLDPDPSANDFWCPQCGTKGWSWD